MAARKGTRTRPKSERCTAKTKSGGRCQRKRAPGEVTCRQHANHGGLTDEIADRIVELLRAGGLPGGVAGAVGVSSATLAAWLERGDPDRDGFDPTVDEHFRAFRVRCDEARAAAEDEAIRAIRKAAEGGDWRASAWYLERIAPERWAGPRRSSATRDPGDSSSKAPVDDGKQPALRLVDDLVAADGRPL